MKEQIQDSLEITRSNEKAYLNELVAYWLQFEGYTYDWLTSKLVEKPITISQKFLLVKAITTTMNSRKCTCYHYH